VQVYRTQEVPVVRAVVPVSLQAVPAPMSVPVCVAVPVPVSASAIACASSRASVCTNVCGSVYACDSLSLPVPVPTAVFASVFQYSWQCLCQRLCPCQCLPVHAASRVRLILWRAQACSLALLCNRWAVGGHACSWRDPEVSSRPRAPVGTSSRHQRLFLP
jgi:hypothetical protein